MVTSQVGRAASGAIICQSANPTTLGRTLHNGMFMFHVSQHVQITAFLLLQRTHPQHVSGASWCIFYTGGKPSNIKDDNLLGILSIFLCREEGSAGQWGLKVNGTSLLRPICWPQLCLRTNSEEKGERLKSRPVLITPPGFLRIAGGELEGSRQWSAPGLQQCSPAYSSCARLTRQADKTQ